MTLIILVVALILGRVMVDTSLLRSDRWFFHYRDNVVKRLPLLMNHGLISVLCILIPPVLIVLTLQIILSGVLFHFFDLVLGVIVLFYCLNTFELSRKVEQYLQARENGETEEAWKIAESFAEEPLSNLLHAQSNAMTYAILYRASIDIFSVIFWFVLLGPVGALLYKTTTLLVKESENTGNREQAEAADAVWGVLGWIPFRLVALSFFLVGSFDDAFKAWRKHHRFDRNLSETNREIVIGTGCGAMQHEIEDMNSQEVEASLEEDIEWVQITHQLVFRAIIIWLAFIAVLTMAGWFV